MAGKHGLIHYSFVTARWKLFGNVQQVIIYLLYVSNSFIKF